MTTNRPRETLFDKRGTTSSEAGRGTDFFTQFSHDYFLVISSLVLSYIFHQPSFSHCMGLYRYTCRTVMMKMLLSADQLMYPLCKG